MSVAGVLLTVAVLLVPAASATPIKIRPPYSGTTWTSKSPLLMGCGYNHVRAGDPTFRTSSGRAYFDQSSANTPCGNISVEFAYEQDIAGFNSSAFVPASSLSHATLKMKWFLHPLVVIALTWGNSSQTTYGSVEFNVTGIVIDQTTGTTYQPTNGFDNFTFFSDTNIYWSPSNVVFFPTLFFNLSLNAHHRYTFHTALTVTTVSDMVGLTSKAGAGVILDPRALSGYYGQLESVVY